MDEEIKETSEVNEASEETVAPEAETPVETPEAVPETTE